MKFVAALLSFLALSPISAYANQAEDALAIAEAGLANSEARRTDLLAPLEAAKLQAETAKLIQEAYRALTEARLNEARTQQIYQEIAQLQQRMRIREHEFARITAADFEMQRDTALVQNHANLVKPLVLGRASWRTWVGVEFLLERCVDADVIVATMFDIQVEPLPASEFSGMGARDFPGGNLGELYMFAQRQDVGFLRFGKAHKYVMKVLAMVDKAAELRIDELRDINQAIRLTIANIQ